jgi:Zn-dependent M28 family amino/carboxypeptidase
MKKLCCRLMLCCIGHLFSIQAFAAATEQLLLQDIRALSEDRMQGRKTGQPGAALARDYITQRFQQLKLNSFTDNFSQPFDYTVGFSQRQGINLLGWIKGCSYPDSYIIVTAHYDHLGMTGRSVYNGADDNASGVATMLALASKFQQQCPAYSYIFVATDAEENGLFGAKALVKQAPVPLDQIVLNLNLDMLSRGEKKNLLYLYGARSLPGVSDYVKQQSFALKLKLRRHGKAQGQSGTDWANASDHAAFRKAGIPFLYFGVDPHADYHSVKDDWQRIKPDFLQAMFSTVTQVVLWLDQQPPAWYQAARKNK